MTSVLSLSIRWHNTETYLLILRQVIDNSIRRFLVLHTSVLHLGHVSSLMHRHACVYLTISCRLLPTSSSHYQLNTSSFFSATDQTRHPKTNLFDKQSLFLACSCIPNVKIRLLMSKISRGQYRYLHLVIHLTSLKYPQTTARKWKIDSWALLKWNYIRVLFGNTNLVFKRIL